MLTPKEFLSTVWTNGNHSDHCLEDVYDAMLKYAEYASNNGKPHVLRRLAYSVIHRLDDPEDQKIFLDEQRARDYCKANDGYGYSSVELMA